jgi:hypothetical protein
VPLLMSLYNLVRPIPDCLIASDIVT